MMEEKDTKEMYDDLIIATVLALDLIGGLILYLIIFVGVFR